MARCDASRPDFRLLNAAAAGALAMAVLAPAAFADRRAPPHGRLVPAPGPALCDAARLPPETGTLRDRLCRSDVLNVALLPAVFRPARPPVLSDTWPFVSIGNRYVTAKPRLRRKARRRQARQRQVGQPECKAWKYHGADQIPRPYDPDVYAYTEEYKRDPVRPGREETARFADARFPRLIGDKVLRMLYLINRVRARRGHTTMKLEPRLMLAAKRHNLDIAHHALMQHTGTDCSQLGDRVWDTGYTWTRIAENLAGGRPTAAATMRQWTGSTRHLMQMTLTGMTEVGIAYDHNPNPPRFAIPIKHFWTLIMARPDPWRDHRWPKKPEPCTGPDCPKGTGKKIDQARKPSGSETREQ